MYGTYFHAWDKLKLNNNNNNNNNVNQIENNNKDNIEEITSKEEKIWNSYRENKMAI